MQEKDRKNIGIILGQTVTMMQVTACHSAVSKHIGRAATAKDIQAGDVELKEVDTPNAPELAVYYKGQYLGVTLTTFDGKAASVELVPPGTKKDEPCLN